MSVTSKKDAGDIDTDTPFLSPAPFDRRSQSMAGGLGSTRTGRRVSVDSNATIQVTDDLRYFYVESR